MVSRNHRHAQNEENVSGQQMTQQASLKEVSGATKKQNSFRQYKKKEGRVRSKYNITYGFELMLNRLLEPNSSL